MNNGELIEAVSKIAGISKTLAGEVLDSIIGTVTKTLRKGDNVVLA